MLYDYVTTSVETLFETIKVLKEGARGQVSLLRHKETGTKMIFRHFQGDGEVYRKLLRVGCAHLPQIFEVAERDGQVLVLEEYVKGDSLAFVLEGGVLSSAQTKNVAHQICNALWVLHSLGVVHRDVKPDNVILRGDEAVLIDFDASRIYNPQQEQDTRVLGTIGYAAPEQYGINQSDSRADIYSMGVLLNIMLTGKHPSLELAVGKLGRIIQRCTAVNPQKRYQNVIQLIDALS